MPPNLADDLQKYDTLSFKETRVKISDGGSDDRVRRTTLGQRRLTSFCLHTNRLRILSPMSRKQLSVLLR